MRILFTADGRSPIAQGWIRYFIDTGHEVHLATTFAADPIPGAASTTFVPLAFSQAKSSSGAQGRRGIWKASAVGLRTTLRHWLGPVTIPGAGKKLAGLIRTVKPDLVHALRIPYEGMAAAWAVRSLRREGFAVPPLVVSVWGNDFTLHGEANWLMRRRILETLEAAAALHTDCERDARLARKWGFTEKRSILVVPTAGGIHLNVFHPPVEGEQIPGLVIQPRGVRAYVRNDTFFAAVPLILAQRPTTRFICPAMKEDSTMQALVDRLGIGEAVRLLPRMPHEAMADLFRQAEVVVSVTNHDGTPNTLLEAMACGCFPVAGDIETTHEWIRPGENGLVVAPDDAGELARAVVAALNDAGWRARAAAENRRIIEERAEYEASMRKAEMLYRAVTGQTSGS